MSHLLDDDDLMPRRERELTLSTGSILGIFFGLVLVCGLFFAFGYNLGKKATVAPVVVANGENDAGNGAQFDKFKPSAGSPAGSASSSSSPVQSSSIVSPPAATEAAPPTKPAASTASAEEPASATTRPTAAPTSLSTPVRAGAGTPTPAMPPVSATGSYVVQVAAVSHQEDADLLVGALRSKGYSVAARPEAQDKLLHIQVGPFASKKDADAMRQRLLGDGYNAIVK